MRKSKQGVAFLLCLMMLLTSAMPAYADNTQLVDIEGHWARSVIQAAADSGLIKGYSDRTFKPDNTISRA